MTAAALALGIAAASFWSAAEKDTAESPTAKPERTKKIESWKLKVESWKLKVESWKLKAESWKLKVDRWIWGKGEKGEKDVKGERV